MSQTMAIVVSRNSADADPESPGYRLRAVVSMLLEAPQSADYHRQSAVKMLFYTEGLSWLLGDSEVLPQLQELESKGIEMLVCRSCARECGMQDQLQVGRMESQDRIQEVMWSADHVVVV